MAGYRIVNAGNLGLSLDSLTNDLATVCNGACGGTLSKFLSTCGTEGRSFAYLITISCLRRPDNGYCVEQLPNLLNITNFMAAESCLTYTPGTLCPIGCAEPLPYKPGIITAKCTALKLTGSTVYEALFKQTNKQGRRCDSRHQKSKTKT